MSVVVFVLLVATILAGAGLLAAMFGLNRPFYGALGIGVLLGPATVLAFVYLAIA